MAMLPSRYDPFQVPFFSLRRDVDRLFREFLRDLGGTSEVTGEGEMRLAPRLDMEEKGDRILLRAELPGVDPKNVKIQVLGNTLRIEGEQRAEDETQRVYRRYESSITLPDMVDASKIQATSKNGILTLALPRSQQAKPREIPVNVEGAAKQIEVKGGEKPSGEKGKKEAA
ncbi:MAG TPA: Hsp20/alpha crystallin family protein [Planctomycetota bacterium]|nr:Hsp20/alpha crystallin family protein [Planctomycetota bacterium]